jgi:hypothetical protein
MAKIEGIRRVQQALQAKLKKFGRKTTVVVGYTKNYAIFVHEINKNYRVGQWKYLETPAREKASEIAEVVRETVQATGSLEAGLLVGGMRLQRESQKLCPVRTGDLKGSAFTEVEK